MMVANATGCSSIYGANLPVTPWTKNEEGRGPAWSNSLFEDNAEFGLGFRLAADKHHAMASSLLQSLSAELGEAIHLRNFDGTASAGIGDPHPTHPRSPTQDQVAQTRRAR
jgi:pyruvate/2-oxoacid:ferredoxin oxidoreductase beta subunit